MFVLLSFVVCFSEAGAVAIWFGVLEFVVFCS